MEVQVLIKVGVILVITHEMEIRKQFTVLLRKKYLIRSHFLLRERIIHTFSRL
jgi:hypothetical protein